MSGSVNHNETFALQGEFGVYICWAFRMTAYCLLERTVHASISCAFFCFCEIFTANYMQAWRKNSFFILVVLFPSITFSTSDKRSLMCSRYICACACVTGLSWLVNKVFDLLPSLPVVFMHLLEDFELFFIWLWVSSCWCRHREGVFLGAPWIHRPSLVFKKETRSYLYFSLLFRFSMDTSKFIPSERKNCFPWKT